MSNIVPKTWTTEQLQLITDSIAKGATPDELKLFLYRCQTLGLDPLKPGVIHFIKYGTNPGAIVIGIEGFRSLAAKTGKVAGVSRGLIKDHSGALLGAWAEIYRSDWIKPAREEVSLKEYSTGKGNWVKMPETMIKKVAECAALRMAFPDDLGGVYEHAEMDQAAPEEQVEKKSQVSQKLIAESLQELNQINQPYVNTGGAPTSSTDGKDAESVNLGIKPSTSKIIGSTQPPNCPICGLKQFKSKYETGKPFYCKNRNDEKHKMPPVSQGIDFDEPLPF